MKKILLLFSIICFSLQLNSETMRSTFYNYFNTLTWTVPSDRLNTVYVEPYSIEGQDKSVFFADSTNQEAIFPVLKGIGIMNYRNIPSSLLSTLKRLIPKIKTHNIKATECSSEKKYLPSLLNFRFQTIQPITQIYYGCPEILSNGKAIVKMRIESAKETKKEFRIILMHLSGEKKTWLISQVDFKGLTNEFTIEPN